MTKEQLLEQVEMLTNREKQLWAELNYVMGQKSAFASVAESMDQVLKLTEPSEVESGQS